MREIIVKDTETNVEIGRQGEHRAVAVCFERQWWVDTYGAGTFNIVIIRPTETTPYVGTLDLTDPEYVKWVVSNADTSIVGKGQAELQYFVGDDMLAKSLILTTTVREALEDTEETIDPIDGWRSTFIDEVAAMQQVATAAGQSAAAAAASATAAATSETNAASSASAAAASATAAATSKTNAYNSEINAAQSAADAAQSAINASAAAASIREPITTVTTVLENSSTYPFTMAPVTIALPNTAVSTDYIVNAEVLNSNAQVAQGGHSKGATTYDWEIPGSVGDIVITDKLANGFKAAFTGSALAAQVHFIIFGGYEYL